MNNPHQSSWKKQCLVIGSMMALFFIGVGCDDADTGSVITVLHDVGGDPQTGPATLVGRGSVLFTAEYRGNALNTATNQTDELHLPLEWSVNNPDLGRISGRGGHEAVYVSSGRTGHNVVFVKDQRGREGVTSVDQH